MVGDSIGPYRVDGKLGEGGMGEVYRAFDTTLNRGVAIKILLPAVAADPERLARFSREAQVLASLNHPNIAHIHGLERADVGPFLVMELVEGTTLAERIAHGPLALDETLALARQIVEALEAAHERGIVHRDLKPANIKVTDDGTVKVLDFGLAKAIEGAGSLAADTLANSPTITTPAMMTGAGIILGTAAYMSPEQAKGRAVDRRTDVWAFGCILYEMFTGRRAFDGEDVTETIAAVVRGEPDWSALPPETPAQLRLLLKRCLEKDRRARVADISVARFLMTETLAPPAADLPRSPTPPPAVRRVPIVAATILGVIGGAALVTGVSWAIGVYRAPATDRPARFTLATMRPHPLQASGTDHDLAISPDGSQIVYRAGVGPAAQAQFVARALDDVEVKPLVGTAGARNPFFSPDGRWVGFFTRNELRKIAITGGPVVTVCKITGAPRGASWGDDDAIVFATSAGRLLRVSAGGGNPTPLLSPDASLGEAHFFPFVLQGARAVLFTVRTTTLAESARVDVLDLRSGQRKTLVRGGHDAVFADSGHLVFATISSNSDVERGGSLRAVNFDVKRLQVSGDAVPVIGGVVVYSTGAADYALSRRGDLIYVPVDPRLTPESQPRSLVWVDRQGQGGARSGA